MIVSIWTKDGVKESDKPGSLSSWGGAGRGMEKEAGLHVGT